MMDCVHSFFLEAYGLTADISKAYEAIRTTEESNVVRLMVTTLKKDNYKRRIFIAKTLKFGDKSSATYMEIAILKFVAESCVLEQSKRLLRDQRFSDNPASSYKTKEEFNAVKEDIERAFAKYNIKLKYVLGRTFNEKPTDDHADSQPLFGFLWTRSTDEVTNNLTLNIKGFKKGVKMGKDIKDMSDLEIEEEIITREKMLRVSGQLYKNLEWMYGACSFNWKLLTAMCLEITTPQELTFDISQRDPQLVRQVKEMIKELRSVHQINPYRRAWVNMGEKLMGFFVYVDGSKPAYAAKVFCLTLLTVRDTTRLSSNLI